jgi:hypothetical protein
MKHRKASVSLNDTVELNRKEQEVISRVRMGCTRATHRHIIECIPLRYVNSFALIIKDNIFIFSWRLWAEKKIKKCSEAEKFKMAAEFKMAVKTFFYFKISKMIIFHKNTFVLYFLTKNTTFVLEFFFSSNSKWRNYLLSFWDALIFFLLHLCPIFFFIYIDFLW